VTGDGHARRFLPAMHAFAAAARNDDPADLAALAALAQMGPVALMEAAPPAALPGLVQTRRVPIHQMVLDALPPSDAPAPNAIELADGDAPDLLALAMLTEPGPFFPLTHRMGCFIGVRDETGVLIAMAGERLRFPGHAEVSAVCVRPDHRRKGLAEALMRIIIAGMMAAGERVFLHAFPDNPAVRLYERMGFRIRRTQTLAVFEAITPDP
jgi:ribosomal protein S18 acetylase RimI-like enzyme